MTTFRTSAPVERSFMRDKQWQHPGRREFIHGKVRPMERRRDPSAPWFLSAAALIAALFLGELIAGAFR